MGSSVALHGRAHEAGQDLAGTRWGKYGGKTVRKQSLNHSKEDNSMDAHALVRFARSITLALVASLLVLSFGASSAQADDCTKGQGYWGTHSSQGPSYYDPTWAIVGENTRFFNSPQTWISVIKRDISLGNLYYLMGQVYITTALNLASGAEPTPEALEVFVEAGSLFLEYSHNHNFRRDKAAKKRFLDMTHELAKFNYGPMYCDK
jgi:hypothetical protein